MKIYLDNCVFNRPFDNQANIRIRIETEAKLYIQKQIKDNLLGLIWSYIIDFENEQNPFDERRISISRWKSFASTDIVESESVLLRAGDLTKLGLKAKDALHIACAMSANADYFLTTDDRILNKSNEIVEIFVVNPTEFIKELEKNDN